MHAKESAMEDHPSESCPGKSSRWLATALTFVTVAAALTMMASLKWRYLDRFVAGARHNKIGFDFFPVPRGFINLMKGTSIFLSEVSDYGPYGSWYLYHPFVAVAFGSWTSILPPWIAFAAFVGVSLLVLFLAAWALSSHFEDPCGKVLPFFALFCSLPTYLMLWNAQMHVLTVLAAALILAGLMGLENAKKPADRYLLWILAGVLISLLSKPIALLMLPVLFVIRETRAKMLIAVAIYSAVSLLFLIVPQSNPGGFNGIHWVNLLSAASTPTPTYALLFPRLHDYTGSAEIFALPMFLYRALGGAAPSVVLMLPLLCILVMSLSPLLLSQPAQRARAAIVVVSLSVLSHYLCCYVVWEYHYATLTPLIPLLLWLWRREEVQWLRLLLMTAFVVLLLVFVPTPYFLAPENPARFMTISTLLRVTPALVAFICLALYGTVYVWKARHPASLFGGEPIVEIRQMLPAAGLLGTMFAGLLIAISVSTPRRFWKGVSRWTVREKVAHYEEMTRYSGAQNESGAAIHIVLARYYALNDLRVALNHYITAIELAPTHHELVAEFGVLLNSYAQYRPMIPLFSKLLASCSGNQVDRRQLEHLRQAIGPLEQSTLTCSSDP